MRIEVSLTPALYPYRTIVSRHATVAVDILRATTSICAAFQAGCECVVPLDSLDDLQRYRSLGFALAAERNGERVGDAEYGNSPTAYLRQDMHGVRLAYSTTNGTVAILKGSDADLTLVGAFANLTAVTERLCREERDVVVLCSGWKNDFCTEDTLFAGALIERLGATLKGDAATMALTLWQKAKADPYQYCQNAAHVHRLRRIGVEEDIPFAFRTDTCPVVPVYQEGRLVL